jgi:hypothetical protein
MTSQTAKNLILGLVIIANGFSAVAEARDLALLNKALADSTQERAGVEREYKKNDATSRNSHRAGDLSEIRAISVELGDELGAESGGGDHLKFHDKNRVFREKAVSAKLDREWKDVNRSMKEVSTRSAARLTGHSSAKSQKPSN